MMGSKFLRRLKYYGIGFGIGAIIVTFIMPNRSCSWTPGNRVKNSILNRVIVANSVEWELMQSKGLSKKDILSVLNDGDIDFKNSQKHENPKVYVIEKKFNDKGNYKFYFSIPENSFVSEVKLALQNASSFEKSKTGLGTLIFIPKNPYLFATDSTSIVKCQQNSLNLNNIKKIRQVVAKNARLRFSNSVDSNKLVNYTFEVYRQKDTFSFQSKLYKDKIYITNFEREEGFDCQN